MGLPPLATRRASRRPTSPAHRSRRTARPRDFQCDCRLDLGIDLIWCSPYSANPSNRGGNRRRTRSRKPAPTAGAIVTRRRSRQMLAELASLKQKPDNLLLVGHEPYLSNLLSIVVSGRSGLRADSRKADLPSWQYDRPARTPPMCSLAVVPSATVACENRSLDICAANSDSGADVKTKRPESSLSEYADNTVERGFSDLARNGGMRATRRWCSHISRVVTNASCAQRRRPLRLFPRQSAQLWGRRHRPESCNAIYARKLTVSAGRTVEPFHGLYSRKNRQPE